MDKTQFSETIKEICNLVTDINHLQSIATLNDKVRNDTKPYVPIYLSDDEFDAIEYYSALRLDELNENGGSQSIIDAIKCVRGIMMYHNMIKTVYPTRVFTLSAFSVRVVLVEIIEYIKNHMDEEEGV